MTALNERKRRTLELMTLGGLRPTKVAKLVGVTPHTVRRWLRTDPEFREEFEAWQHGPQPDATTIAQSRRIIIDELARRVLRDRQDMSIRDLLNIHDRLIKETTSMSEEKDDDRSDPADGIELTPEQAERIWAERERQRLRAEADAAAEPDQP